MSHFTETTHVGLVARLKNALKGIGLGISFIGIAVYFLFWNEGNSVRMARALAEGAGRVVSVQAAKPDPANEGALIHISGPLTLMAPLHDPALHIHAHAQSVRLERKVEQYAWIEEKRTATDTNLGGGQEKTTRYTYRMDWTQAPATGTEFRLPQDHLNPPMPLESQVFRQPGGAIGGFEVTDEISDLGGSVPMLLNAEQMKALEQALSFETPAKLVAGQVVFSRNAAAPALGDVRISYYTSNIDQVSAVGEQRSGALAPYTAQNGRKIYLLEKGLKTAEEMFETAVYTNTVKTWMLRFGLMVLLFLGFKALFSLLDVIASLLPVLGWITASVTSLISLALALVVGGSTMALAWFYYRPLLSLAIISVALAGAAISFHLARKPAQRAAEAN